MKYHLSTTWANHKTIAVLKCKSPSVTFCKIGPSFYVWRTQRKIKGMIWVFHKGDDDFNPSLPHGHYFGKARKEYKLELWSGKIIDSSSKEVIGYADPQEMLHLYNDKEFQQFIIETRQAYHDRNPKINLSPLKPNPKWKLAKSLHSPISGHKSKGMFLYILSFKQELLSRSI